MVRIARVKSDSGIYHVMIRGIDKQTILEDEEDHQKFLDILKECKVLSGYKLYGYCLMGNHIHILLKEEEENLEKIFKRIGARYVYYYNSKYKRSGHLFQDRFRSEPVEDDNYLLAVLSYIHNNPVKAGLSQTADQYRWSSYHSYFQVNDFIDAAFILEMIDRETFIGLHQQQDEETILDVKEERFKMTDEEAKIVIEEISGLKNRSDFLTLSTLERNACIRNIKKCGLSIRQIARVTGWSKGIVEKVSKTEPPSLCR
ncbi:transposase [Anaerosinus massiliensis]|uniref:transposase n=1 Tax=Massilibacillus massiliensis TaxID=1806837 RepID=UPI000DA5F271|nr:transposase [Massilibacillus massiliensis]